jgi:hypothetical protein
MPTVSGLSITAMLSPLVTAPEAYDLACVVHLHSTYSDGTGTVPEIIRAGRRAGVDVVLLTDHDSLAALHEGYEGDHDGVLLLVGEEVSPKGGSHYLAFGIDEVIDWRGLSPAEVPEAVRAAGGFGFAAHPFSRGSDRFGRLGTPVPYEALDAVDGVELWSFVTDTAEALTGIPDVVRMVVVPNRLVDHPPAGNLAAWDELCAERRVPAIGGLDAHQVGVRVAGRVPLRLMSYARSFRQLRTHVLARSRDRDGVYEALREGRSYIAMDALAPASGFWFGAGDLQMGEEATAAGQLLTARAPRPAKLRLLRDGRSVAAAEGDSLEQRAEGPGVYRVEARLDAFGRERTWVLTNPIYLR